MMIDIRRHGRYSLSPQAANISLISVITEIKDQMRADVNQIKNPGGPGF
jgi:hypothetical protein